MTQPADTVDLAEVHIKDRSLRFRPECRYARRVADPGLNPGDLAKSSRGLVQTAIFLRGWYSDRHCKAVAMAAWWQSVADARQTNQRGTSK